MNTTKIACLVLFTFLFVPLLHADIYTWTDDEGIKHYTNHPPSSAVGTLTKTEEIPFDEAKDELIKRQIEQREIELAVQKIAEKEAAIEKREKEAEKKLAAAQQKTEETLRIAEKTLELAEKNASAVSSNKDRKITYRTGYLISRSPHKISRYKKNRRNRHLKHMRFVRNQTQRRLFMNRPPLKLRNPAYHTRRNKFLSHRVTPDYKRFRFGLFIHANP